MFRFNDEILIAPEDRALAEQMFPKVYFALAHEEYWQDFKEFDAHANKSKKRSRTFGFWALGLGVASLLTFPLEPLIFAFTGSGGGTQIVFRSIALIGASFGILAIVLGNMGLGFGKSKRRWLQWRLITERMRQWRAQYLLAHVVDIADAAGSDAKEQAFLDKRSLDYARFKREFVDQIGSEYSKFTEQPSIGSVVRVLGQISGAVTFWIDPTWQKLANRKPSKDQEPTVREVFEAYEKTRLRGQIQYTNYILSAEGSFWKLPRKQALILSQVTYSLVTMAFLSNLIALVAAAAPGLPVVATMMGAFGIAMAILAVGVRAVEEGLSPQREVQRMEKYATVIDQVRVNFSSTTSLLKIRHAAKMLEQASHDEMIEFLSANESARFVL